VDQGSGAIDHREYEDLIAVAALGALTPDEHSVLMAHLRTCASCRQVYGHLLSGADALPLAVEERAPSSALRERLRAQVEREALPSARQEPPAREAPPAGWGGLPMAAAPAPAGERARQRWFDRAGQWWLAAAAAMLVVGLLAGVLVDRVWLDEAGTSMRELALQYPTDMTLEDATLAYMPEEGMLKFSSEDMPSPPEGQVYQVWLIGGEGEAPEPMGMIDMESGEFATMVDPDRHETFAVTMEPGPLGSPAPTSDPVVVAEIR
jgi:hypothetical protein